MSAGYGREAWCLTGTSTTRFVSGRALVAQALYRRFTTPRGTLRRNGEALAYGYDVAGLVGRVGSPAALAILPSAMRGEALKDDRVRDVSITVLAQRESNGNVVLTIDMVVVLHDDTEAFPLTLSVADGELRLAGGLPQ